MNYSLDRLARQKEEIEALIKSCQNITPNKDLIEWRILNENEEVDNLFVQNKTLFISDDMMVLKGVDGKLEKWEIKKIYPIDKKDMRINELEEEIKKLKEVLSEHSKLTEPVRERKQSYADDDGDAKPEPEASPKPISKQEQPRASRSNSKVMQ